MRRSMAAAGSTVLLALAPGVVAGIGPWWLTGWHGATWWLSARVLGGVLVLAGALVLVWAFTRFVVEGFGTPAPIAPPRHLVVGGLYSVPITSATGVRCRGGGHGCGPGLQTSHRPPKIPRRAFQRG
jgi:hypothetical protein